MELRVTKLGGIVTNLGNRITDLGGIVTKMGWIVTDLGNSTRFGMKSNWFGKKHLKSVDLFPNLVTFEANYGIFEDSSQIGYGLFPI